MVRVKTKVILIAVLLMLAGCSTTNNSSTQGKAELIKPTFKDTSANKEVKALPSDYKWNKAVLDGKTREGYAYKAELKMSPWINTENIDVLKAAWAEVGQNNSLPITTDDWGLRPYDERFVSNLSSGSDYFSIEKQFQFHYSVGEITIINNTTGWDLSEKDQANFDFLITPSSSTIDMLHELDDKIVSSNPSRCRFMTKTFFETKSEVVPSRYVPIDVEMKENRITIPFVIMHGNTQPSPNYPKGKYIEEIQDFSFTLEGDIRENSVDIRIPIFQ